MKNPSQIGEQIEMKINSITTQNNDQDSMINSKCYLSDKTHKKGSKNQKKNYDYFSNKNNDNIINPSMPDNIQFQKQRNLAITQQLNSNILENILDPTAVNRKLNVEMQVPVNINHILQLMILNLQKGLYLLKDETFLATVAMHLIDNKYIIYKYLTSGGQGDIFIAEQEGSQVILKIYSKIEVEEFKEETDLIASIKTPINILGNLKSLTFKDIGIFVIVQEKCEMSLKDELQFFLNHQKKFKLLHLLEIFFDLLDGLIEMRSHNIVHQDIKPANILKKNAGNYVYTDFGCASKNKNGQVVKKGYTPKYCSPEQLKGVVSYESDVYSLGRTFQEIIQSFRISSEYNSLGETNKNLLIEFEKLINEKMLANIVQGRKEIMDLLITFFQTVNTTEYLEFNQSYVKKIEQIKEFFPFDNTKDTHYFQKVHLYYSIMHLYTLFVIHGSDQSIKISEFIENGSLLNSFNSKINHQDIALSLSNVANCYESLGQFEIALKLNEESLQMKLIIFPNPHESISSSLSSVGKCHFSLSKYDLALKFYFQSADMIKTIFQENHHSLASTYNLIGLAYLSLAEYDLSLKYFLESLEMYKLHLSREHYIVAFVYNNLGLCYQSRGQYDLSLENYLQALDINTKLFIWNHPSIATNLNNIGYCYQTLGKYELALDSLQKSLEMRLFLFSKNHPSVALSFNNVGNTYVSLEKYDEALKNLLESLEIRQKIFPKNNVSIAHSLNNVGLCYKSSGQYELALKFMKESLEMFKVVFSGKIHPNISIALNSIGMCYNSMGEKELSLQYLLESFEMRKQVYSGSHPALADSLNNLGLCYQQIGQFHQSLTYFLESVEMKKTLLKQDHPNMVSCLNDIINFFKQFGSQKQVQDIFKNDTNLLLRFQQSLFCIPYISQALQIQYYIFQQKLYYYFFFLQKLKRNIDPQIKNILDEILK